MGAMPLVEYIIQIRVGFAGTRLVTMSSTIKSDQVKCKASVSIFETLWMKRKTGEGRRKSNHSKKTRMFSKFIHYISQYIQCVRANSIQVMITVQLSMLWSCLEIDVDRAAANDYKTVEAVPGAADRLRGANYIFVSCVAYSMNE
jgi:hypothetical protein